MLIYKKVREWQNERLTGSPLQRKKHDLTGYTEAHLLARRTHAVCSNHDCARCGHIAPREEATAIGTVLHRRVQAEKAHLPAMGMPRKDNISHNRRALGIIRSMCKQNKEGLIDNGINTLYHCGITRETVTHTSNEQPVACRVHARDAVREQDYAMLTHGRGYKSTVPTLMVTKNRICTITRINSLKRREKRHNRIIRSYIIPTQEQQVGMHIGKRSHKPPQPFGIKETWIMDIGDKGNSATVEHGREPVTLYGIPFHAPHPALRQRSTRNKYEEQQQ